MLFPNHFATDLKFANPNNYMLFFKEEPVNFGLGYMFLSFCTIWASIALIKTVLVSIMTIIIANTSLRSGSSGARERADEKE